MTEENFKNDSETVSSGDTSVSETASPQTEKIADKLSGEDTRAERVPGEQGASASLDTPNEASSGEKSSGSKEAPSEMSSDTKPEPDLEFFYDAAGQEELTVCQDLMSELKLLLKSGLITDSKEMKQRCPRLSPDKASEYNKFIPETDISNPFYEIARDGVTIKLPVNINRDYYFLFTYMSETNEDCVVVRHTFRYSRSRGLNSEKSSVSSSDAADSQPDSGKVSGTEPLAATAPECSSQPEQTSPEAVSDDPDKHQTPESSNQPEQTSSEAATDDPDKSQPPESSSQPEQTSPEAVSDDPDKHQTPESSNQPEQTSPEAVSDDPDKPQTPECSSQPEQTSSAAMADELDRLQAPEVSSQPEQTSPEAASDDPDKLQTPEYGSRPEQISPAPITDELDKSQIPEDSSQQELTSFENPAEMLNRFQASENTVRPVKTDPAVSSAAESVTDNNADAQNADLKTIVPSGMLSENEAEKPSENAFAPSGSDKNTDMQTRVFKTIDPPRDSSANETAAPSESFAASAGEPDSVQLKTEAEAKPESAQESPRPINWPRVDDDPKSPAANAKTPHEAEVKQDPVQDAPKPRPNPRALWKDIPSKPDFYPKPDTASDFCLADNGKVKIFGASRRGRSHAHVGSPRDDDFKITTDDTTGWTYLVVADGAGSAKYSRKGAQQACKVVAERLPDLVKNEKFQEALTRLESNPGFGEAELEQLRKSAYYVLPKAAHEASKSLSDLIPSAPEKAELRDFATTFLCVITRKIHDRQLIISFAIGDGAIAVYDANNSANTHLMNTPDSGEYAGQTRFLTMRSIFANPQEIMARIRIQCVPDYTAIMLMTDGVSDAKFETESLLEDKSRWDDFWRDLTVNGSDDSPPLRLDSSAEELSKQLLEWLNFWVVGNHDDRTIVVMYKGGAAK